MLPFQVALEELCVQKPRSHQRAEGYLLPTQESWVPADYWGREGGTHRRQLISGCLYSSCAEELNKAGRGIQRSKGLGHVAWIYGLPSSELH